MLLLFTLSIWRYSVKEFEFDEIMKEIRVVEKEMRKINKVKDEEVRKILEFYEKELAPYEKLLEEYKDKLIKNDIKYKYVLQWRDSVGR